MVNQAFRIKIAYQSKKEEEEKKEKIPAIGRYPMGPTKIEVPSCQHVDSNYGFCINL